MVTVIVALGSPAESSSCLISAKGEFRSRWMTGSPPGETLFVAKVYVPADRVRLRRGAFVACMPGRAYGTACAFAARGNKRATTAAAKIKRLSNGPWRRCLPRTVLSQHDSTWVDGIAIPYLGVGPHSDTV